MKTTEKNFAKSGKQPANIGCSCPLENGEDQGIGDRGRPEVETSSCIMRTEASILFSSKIKNTRMGRRAICCRLCLKLVSCGLPGWKQPHWYLKVVDAFQLAIVSSGHGLKEEAKESHLRALGSATSGRLRALGCWKLDLTVEDAIASSVRGYARMC